MAHRAEFYAQGIDASSHGGGLKFARLGYADLALRRSELNVMPAHTGAECFAMTRVGRATVVTWGGPRWATDKPTTSLLGERIFCQVIPDSLW